MTTQHHRIEATWTEVASGPALIEAISETVHVHIGESAPEANTRAYHPLSQSRGMSLPYGGTQRIYARANDGFADIVVTEGA